MTPEQANKVRKRFYNTPGWNDLVKHHPRFDAALKALPDEFLLRRCIVILREMVDDAVREVEQLAADGDLADAAGEQEEREL